MSNQLDGDTVCTGTFTAKRFNPPAGCINDAAVVAGADIDADKLEHPYVIHYTQDSGTAIVAGTRLLHTVRGGTARVKQVDVMCTTAPTGDHTVTVDIKAGNTSDAFASILGSVVTLDNATVAKTVYEASITSPDLADDDTIEIVVAVAGSTSSQGQGLLVTVTIYEDPT
jgi:hypothetical protein